MKILFGSGAYSAEPLRKLVEAHVDQDLLADVAAEYNKGRVLLVATTDVDSQRTAIWNMGRHRRQYVTGRPETVPDRPFGLGLRAGRLSNPNGSRSPPAAAVSANCMSMAA